MKRINHQAPMSTTLLTDQQSWTAEEILQRTRFATGSDASPPTTADRMWQIRVVATNAWRVG
jgi:hypothetical protein